MAKQTSAIGDTMRPYIQISHQDNGRVKDFGSAHDLNTNEAYLAVILAGINELENTEELPDWIRDELDDRNL